MINALTVEVAILSELSLAKSDTGIDLTVPSGPEVCGTSID
jgi:hypothetical protein